MGEPGAVLIHCLIDGKKISYLAAMGEFVVIRRRPPSSPFLVMNG